MPITFKTYTTVSLVLLGTVLFPLPASNSAQSLGEVARLYRKEREARKKKGEIPVKVFTNDDVAKMSPPAINRPSEQKSAVSGGGPHSPETAGGKTPLKSSAAQSGNPESSKKTRAYWQARFKTARAALAHAKEEQTLVEDELHLLQIQQARELNPDRSRKLNSEIDAAGVELEAKRAATQKTQAAMDETEKEFKKSGAPQDWIQDKEGPE